MARGLSLIERTPRNRVTAAKAGNRNLQEARMGGAGADGAVASAC